MPSAGASALEAKLLVVSVSSDKGRRLFSVSAFGTKGSGLLRSKVRV